MNWKATVSLLTSVVVLMYAERVLPVDSQAVQAIQDLHPSIYVKRSVFFSRS
jgi:hypothetical protein